MSSCEEPTCWFCWDSVDQEQAAPSLGCSCKGGLSTAHRSCMKEWLSKNPESCPNCRVPYNQKVVSKLVSPRSSVKSKSAGKCGSQLNKLITPLCATSAVKCISARRSGLIPA